MDWRRRGLSRRLSLSAGGNMADRDGSFQERQVDRSTAERRAPCRLSLRTVQSATSLSARNSISFCQTMGHTPSGPNVEREAEPLYFNSLQLNVAGVAGFEPANAGTKNRCLTTWRHPNAVLAALPDGWGRGSAGGAYIRKSARPPSAFLGRWRQARVRHVGQPMRWTQPFGSGASPRWIDTRAERSAAVTGPD